MAGSALLQSLLPPRVCSNSRPLSWWCCLTILSSAIPFSICFQSFPTCGLFQRVGSFTLSGQSTGASASVFPMFQCCTQYVSKFGKLSSDHRTGKSQFSIQSLRRLMPKNVQTTVQLCSFHMLARLYSKSFKLGFRSMWTKNFQIHKLGFEEA